MIINTSTNHGKIINEDLLLEALHARLGTEPTQKAEYFEVKALKEKITQLEITVEEMDDYINKLIDENIELEKKIRKEYQPVQDSRKMLLV